MAVRQGVGCPLPEPPASGQADQVRLGHQRHPPTPGGTAPEVEVHRRVHFIMENIEIFSRFEFIL